MAWHISEDMAAFDAAAGRFLLSDPVIHTQQLTVIQQLRSRGSSAFGSDSPVLAWWVSERDAVEGVFVQTPPWPVLCTRVPAEAAADLADALVARGRTAEHFSAAEETATAFAARWTELTGTLAQVHERIRLYRLGTFTPPKGIDGRARTATRDDRDLCIRMFHGFRDELGGGPQDIPGTVDDRLAFGGITLWDVDGVAVALAAMNHPVAGAARIGPVYTPPEFRRNGYAAGATAARTTAALDDGATEVLLFTDLANPTSNAVYQRLGYEAVQDRVVLRFAATDE
jgi:hypothetical protein